VNETKFHEQLPHKLLMSLY